MKIKKKTSMMLLATSAAAVVGVAAVSFVAWNGGTTLTVNGETGTAVLEGFVGATAVFDGKLVPWDQSENSVSAGSATVINAEIDYVVVENYSITVELTSATTLNATYYAMIDGNQTADFEIAEGVPAGWIALELNTAKELIVTTATPETIGARETKYLHLAMASDDSSSDSEKAFELEIVYHSVTFNN